MTTKDFMNLIGVTQPNTITRYLKSGVLNPKKVFGAYIFGSEDVDDYNEYKKTGVRKYLKHSTDNEKSLKSASTKDLITELYNRTSKTHPNHVMPEPEYVWED